MGKINLMCDWCGKIMGRYPSQVKPKNFCSRSCLGSFSSKTSNPAGYTYRSFELNSQRFTKMNEELNPDRMTQETRGKLRCARLGTGEGKTYTKVYGRHEHRIAAEQKLGRSLYPGEVVHHIDGNKRNNRPENLMVFKSQKEHAAWHAKWNSIVDKWLRKEVMPA